MLALLAMICSTGAGSELPRDFQKRKRSLWLIASCSMTLLSDDYAPAQRKVARHEVGRQREAVAFARSTRAVSRKRARGVSV